VKLFRIAFDHDQAREEVTPEVRAVLVEHARLFLAAGGTLTLEDWADLTQPERAAFVAAGKALAVEQAVRVGKASQGELAALRVFAEVDGGEAHDAAALEVAVKQLARASREVPDGR